MKKNTKKKVEKKNNNIVKIVVACVVIVVVLYLVLPSITSKEIKDIKSLEYTVSGWGSWTYKVDCTDTCVSNGKEIDKDKLIKILNKYNVSSWDGFDKQAKGIYDGSGFNLKIVLTNGKVITAHGYVKFPRGYTGFNKEILELIGQDNITRRS